MKLIVKVIYHLFSHVSSTDREFLIMFKGDRDPKHRAEEIIRTCNASGGNKLSKEEVS